MTQDNQSTDLALANSGGMISSDGPSDSEQEQKSGFLGALSGVDVLRQVTLIIALTICVAIAVFIIIWARQPDMRPLGTMPTDELIQTLDFLDVQFKEFLKAFDRCIHEEIPKLVVVHGIGKGILKNKIHQFLAENEKINHFKDAQKEKFGFGATEITFV